jgi:hypothetical protein
MDEALDALLLPAAAAEIADDAPLADEAPRRAEGPRSPRAPRAARRGADRTD